MGKPYASEIAILSETYTDARDSDPKLLARSLSQHFATPLLVVGSGGSLTAAHIAVLQHQARFGQMAKVVTPLELMHLGPSLGRVGILFLSAGGSNPDVLGAFRAAVKQEPRHISVLCGRAESPLMRLGAGKPHVSCVAFDFPGKKDGFLATNSLMSTCVRLVMAYEAASGIEASLPSRLEGLGSFAGRNSQFTATIERGIAPLWDRESLLVLYGPSTQAGAADVESRFHEAALGAVQIADFRNFAHGRHQWLAKRGETTGVLAFISKDDAALADRTLALLPSQVVVVRANAVGSGATAAMSAVLYSMLLAGAAGRARAIDPGRPGVPAFGRRIYRLNVPRESTHAKPTPMSVALARKQRACVVPLVDARVDRAWSRARESFVKELRSQSFGAVVLDHDGTLCASHQKGKQLSEGLAQELTRLLRAGVGVGIATGRGKSVREELQRSLPKQLWPKVLVGYYNGGDLGTLDDNSHPDGSECSDPSLEDIAKRVRADIRLSTLCDITVRRHQITLEPRRGPADSVWEIAHDLTLSMALREVRVVRSSHSVDVLSPHARKRRVVEALGDAGRPVLCLGDRGRWPGNDHDLLATRFSLSVDDVSSDPGTCWNLAPQGVRGLDATLFYLKSLRTRRGSAAMSI